MTKMKKMPNVQYTLNLKYQRQTIDTWEDHKKKLDTFYETVKNRLVAYEGIQVIGHTYIIPTLEAKSAKADFEQLYHVKLKLETEYAPNLNGPLIKYVADKEPSVPKELEDIISSIIIDTDEILTD